MNTQLMTSVDQLKRSSPPLRATVANLLEALVAELTTSANAAHEHHIELTPEEL